MILCFNDEASVLFELAIMQGINNVDCLKLECVSLYIFGYSLLMKFANCYDVAIMQYKV